MSKTYLNVRPYSVLRYFRGIEPCNCHHEHMKDSPRYNVKTKTGQISYGSHGTLIKKISLECTVCHKVRETDVRHFAIRENDFFPVQ